MPAFDWSIVSAAMSAVTAIAAITAPVITSVSANRSQERIKKLELHAPLVYNALADMTKSFSAMLRSNELDSTLEHSANLRVAKFQYETFRAATLTVLSLVPGEAIQQQASELLDAIRKTNFLVFPANDEQFLELLNSVNAYMLSLKEKNIK